MKQRHVPPSERPRPASGLDDTDQDTARESVIVCSGIYEHRLDIAGMTVGEARERLSERMDIHPNAAAIVNGDEVGDEHVLGPGMVTFVNRAGEKGAASRRAARVLFEGERAVTLDSTGAQAEMPLPEFVKLLNRGGNPPDQNVQVVPPGCRIVAQSPQCLVALHETSPRVHNLTWITDDSPRHHGPTATFRQVRLALPYVQLLVVFLRSSQSWSMTTVAAVFFTRESVTGRSDALYLPALLNCMRHGDLISQLCTQGMARERGLSRSPEESLCRGVSAMHAHLFAARFNRHPEAMGQASWFTETAINSEDIRLRSVEAWEAATRDAPDFALEAGWLPARITVGDVLDQLVASHSFTPTRIQSANDAARILARFGQKVATQEVVE